MLLYAISVLFVVTCQSVAQGFVCNWIYGYSGYSVTQLSLGRLQDDALCIVQCNNHGATYAQYNFDDKSCICLQQFIGMISSSDNVAICRTEKADKTVNAFDVIHAEMFYSDLQHTNRSLVNHLLKDKEVNSLTECLHLCLKCRMEGNCKCLSANFSHFKVGSMYKCELNNATHFNYERDFVEKVGFQHYELLQ